MPGGGSWGGVGGVLGDGSRRVGIWGKGSCRGRLEK